MFGLFFRLRFTMLGRIPASHRCRKRCSSAISLSSQQTMPVSASGQSFPGQNDTTLDLVHMLKLGMQKKPATALDYFNSIFTTQVLISIIGCLLGIVAMRLLGG